MYDYNLGFKANGLSVQLKDRTFHNDSCRSFYFIKNNDFYILYVEPENICDREEPSHSRYSVCSTLNLGDQLNIELECYNMILETDCKNELIDFINKL